MGRVKHQHFVPQFYLKQFTEDGKRLHVFDKHSQKSYVSRVETTGSRMAFYEWVEEDVTQLLSALEEDKKSASGAELSEIEEAITLLREHGTQFVEIQLSRIEAVFSEMYRQALTELEKTRVPNFLSNGRLEFAMFIALQFLRTFEAREDIREHSNKFVDAVGKMMLRMAKAKGEPELENVSMEDIERLTLSYDDKAIKLMQMRQLLDLDVIEKYASILQNHIWCIRVNKSHRSLWTSDHPIARRAHKIEPFKSNFGIAAPGIEVVFPLTPKYVLVMLERSHFSNWAKLDGQFLALQPHEITYYNCLQVNNSFRQVFSPNADFGLAEKMCRKDPSLTDPKRSRWSVISG